MRCFAPAVGIPEDPFTGSVLGGLALYITRNKLIPAKVKTVRIEQGHFMSRPGYVDLKLGTAHEAPLVIAKARHFFSTEIHL
jgi:predicted PhzF superfamily epimerase YddE/YHI9